MSDQPKALRLADRLEKVRLFGVEEECWEAADELRRHHDEIEALQAERDALKDHVHRLESLCHDMAGELTVLRAFKQMQAALPETFKSGCRVCGIGADGKAYAYVCTRSDCPTRITCGGDK